MNKKNSDLPIHQIAFCKFFFYPLICMHEFYPFNKARFSACLCKIYTVGSLYDYCGNFIIVFLWFLVWAKLGYFFLFDIKLSLEKVKKSKIKISKEVTCLFFAVDFNLFSGIFVSATFASSKFAIFYKTVKLPWENFNLVSLIFF